MARKLARADWAQDPERWSGHFEGRDLDTGVTVLFATFDAVGAGPRLHRHPYDEVFIIRQGRARFHIDEESVEAEAGDVVMAPAGSAHRFENLGPGRLESTDIHLSPEWIQEDLD